MFCWWLDQRDLALRRARSQRSDKICKIWPRQKPENWTFLDPASKGTTVPFQSICPTRDFPTFSENLRKSEKLRKNCFRGQKKLSVTRDGRIDWNGTVLCFPWTSVIPLRRTNQSALFAQLISHCHISLPKCVTVRLSGPKSGPTDVQGTYSRAGVLVRAISNLICPTMKNIERHLE